MITPTIPPPPIRPIGIGRPPPPRPPPRPPPWLRLSSRFPLRLPGFHFIAGHSIPGRAGLGSRRTPAGMAGDGTRGARMRRGIGARFLTAAATAVSLAGLYALALAPSAGAVAPDPNPW